MSNQQVIAIYKAAVVAERALFNAQEKSEKAAGLLVAYIDEERKAGRWGFDQYKALRDAVVAGMQAEGMSGAAADKAWSRLFKLTDEERPKAATAAATKKASQRAAPSPEQVAEARATFEQLKAAPLTAEGLKAANAASAVLLKAQKAEAAAKAKAEKEGESAATKAARAAIQTATKDPAGLAYLAWALSERGRLEVVARGEATITLKAKRA